MAMYSLITSVRADKGHTAQTTNSKARAMQALVQFRYQQTHDSKLTLCMCCFASREELLGSFYVA